MQPDVKGRPLADDQEGGPTAKNGTITTANLADCGDRMQQARAVVLPPCGRRTWWAASWCCPWCGGMHLSRARTEDDLLAPRRGGCGRPVVLAAGSAG